MIAGILLTCAMIGLPPSLLNKLQSLEVSRTPRIVVITVSDQKLRVFEKGRVEFEHPISTARNGLGQRVDTYRTPIGLHRIRQKIGGDAPEGAIFENRKFTGEIWDPAVPLPLESHIPRNENFRTTDLITSRILWLEGLEPGFNLNKDSEGILVDSYQRYIYIHGTNHEDEIGRPTSRGCIRMFNSEIVALFDKVKEGDLVWIEP